METSLASINLPNLLGPKPEDLESEDFNQIWDCIKTWNILTGYGRCGCNYKHVMAILFATKKRDPNDYV